jgi:protein dithiol:quinone oxidoreductase
MTALRLQFIFSRRIGNLLGFLVCAGLIASAYYLQLVKGVEPCPLCIMQRVAVFLTGIAFLVAALHHPGRIGAFVYGGLISVISLVGTAVAGRHVWLQYMPADKRPACGPGLDYLLGTFGPLEGVRRILHGSGECGVVDFTLLGLSLPHWTLLAFIVLAIWATVLALRD